MSDAHVSGSPRGSNSHWPAEAHTGKNLCRSHRRDLAPVSILCFQDPSETPPATRVETREERRERRKKEKAEETAYQLEQAIALWDPNNNPSATADPFKTLFIARINYETSEGKLRREFEQYGAIKQVRLHLQLGFIVSCGSGHMKA